MESNSDTEGEAQNEMDQITIEEKLDDFLQKVVSIEENVRNLVSEIKAAVAHTRAAREIAISSLNRSSEVCHSVEDNKDLKEQPSGAHGGHCITAPADSSDSDGIPDKSNNATTDVPWHLKDLSPTLDQVRFNLLRFTQDLKNPPPQDTTKVRMGFPFSSLFGHKPEAVHDFSSSFGDRFTMAGPDSSVSNVLDYKAKVDQPRDAATNPFDAGNRSDLYERLTNDEQLVFQTIASNAYLDGIDIVDICTELETLDKDLVVKTVKSLTDQGCIYETDEKHFKVVR